jgi:hypothetical protein
MMRRTVIPLKAIAALLILGAALAAGGAAAARTPTGSQKAALIGALQREQGEVAIVSISISTANPVYASMNWGFRTAVNNSLFQLAGGQWKVLWTRESEQPADGACVYVPAQVARDLLKVTCPSAAALHARPATSTETDLLRKSFRASPLTPYAKSARALAHVCVSRLSPTWAAAEAQFSGTSGVVWFTNSGGWKVADETLIGRGTPPPHSVILSLAACVGYNPADF